MPILRRVSCMANSSGVRKPVLSLRMEEELSLSDDVLSFRIDELHFSVRTQSFSLSSSEKSEATTSAGRASRAAVFLYEDDEDELAEEDEELFEDELFELLLDFSGDDSAVFVTGVKEVGIFLTFFTAVCIEEEAELLII